MDFFELTKARYSVRKYADRPVEQDKLDKDGNIILED